MSLFWTVLEAARIASFALAVRGPINAISDDVLTFAFTLAFSYSFCFPLCWCAKGGSLIQFVKGFVV